LAAVLHEHYIAYQQQQNVQCWQKPTILSMNAWLESLWQNYLVTTTDKAPYLLNAAQTHLLWETIIAGDQSHNLLQIADTADALKTAWELICQYEVDIHDPAFQLTEDYTLCQQWILQYQALSHEHHYIDNAVLPDFLAEKMNAGEIVMPEKIMLYGFTEVIPQYEKLLSSCAKQRSNGCWFVLPLPIEGRHEPWKVRSASTGMYVPEIGSGNTNQHTQSAISTSMTALPDSDREIITLARFAKATHAAHPDATIGCVILDLNLRRERVLQLFTQVFFPEKPFDVDPIDYPFNISAGKNLGSYPVIATALLICGITNTMTREHFSSILLSPYIGEAESKSAERAKLDAELRRKNVHQVVISEWIPACAGMTVFEGMTNFKSNYNDKKSFAEWAQHFNNMLAAFGWPGEKSLSSEEYQVAHAWLGALTDLASLDKITAPVSKK
jgi:hypothetical protein